MNREQLKDIRARWTDYLAKSDAERKVLFEFWWDKRDFWDLCGAVENALDGVDLESGQPAMLRMAADALATVTKHQMIMDWVQKYNESQDEVTRLREVLRQVQALAWTPTMKASRQIRELTKEYE